LFYGIIISQVYKGKSRNLWVKNPGFKNWKKVRKEVFPKVK
jgi:hypothetical protein